MGIFFEWMQQPPRVMEMRAERHLAVQLMSLPASLVPVSPAIHKYAVPVQGPGDPLTTAVAPVGPPTISIRYNLNSVT